MSTTVSKKRETNQQTTNSLNLLEGKRFNEILIAVVSISAVLVILWG